MTIVAEDYTGLVRQVRRTRSVLDRQAGQAEQVIRQLRLAESEAASLAAQADLHRKAEALFTSLGEQAQETARQKIEELATRALQVIFGAEHSFVLNPGQRAGQATLELLIRSVYPDGVVETPVLEARGGGMAAVIGFVLRLVVLLLTPELRRVLVLDEPFAMVSASFEGSLAEFLVEVARKTSTQIVLVTHSPIYGGYADQRARLSLSSSGVTEVHLGESE